MCCACFAANTSPPQARSGKKDAIAAVLGTKRKKRRHRHKGDSSSSIPASDTVASKFSHDTNLKPGLRGNRSAENILQQVGDESADAAEMASENVEVTFEIRKKYDVTEFSYFCVENEKRSIRRAKSNDSLMPQNRIVVRRPIVDSAARDKSQTLPKDLSKSQEMLDDYVSSGDVTTSEDGRSESCGSSVLESEL